jgi:hypothetical protein
VDSDTQGREEGEFQFHRVTGVEEQVSGLAPGFNTIYSEKLLSP